MKKIYVVVVLVALSRVFDMCTTYAFLKSSNEMNPFVSLFEIKWNSFIIFGYGLIPLLSYLTFLTDKLNISTEILDKHIRHENAIEKVIGAKSKFYALIKFVLWYKISEKRIVRIAIIKSMPYVIIITSFAIGIQNIMIEYLTILSRTIEAQYWQEVVLKLLILTIIIVYISLRTLKAEIEKAYKGKE